MPRPSRTVCYPRGGLRTVRRALVPSARKISSVVNRFHSRLTRFNMGHYLRLNTLTKLRRNYMRCAHRGTPRKNFACDHFHLRAMYSRSEEAGAPQ